VIRILALKVLLVNVDGVVHLDVTLDGIAEGRLTAVPQPTEGVSLAPKITVAQARVRWDLPATVVERRIRSVTPDPGAWTMVDDLRLKLGPVTVDKSADPLPPGRLSAGREGVRVGTGSRPVLLGLVQPPGRKPMAAADWVRGARLGDGARAL
jgi:methionyl-tRNA formyltransferase